MNLSKLLNGIIVTKLFQTMYGNMVVTQDFEISKIHYDSRKVQMNDCFVAIKGVASDGHTYLQDAINKGAKVIVVQDDNALPDSFCMHSRIIKVVVQDTRKALAIMAANFYGNPANNLNLIGITGTNGKTTTSHIVKSILEESGEKVGLIGTIEYKIGDKIIPATNTTPEATELHQLFSLMKEEKCSAVSMEVSSHSLDLSRVYGLDFDAAIFTNLTQDHLDYHQTMDKYFEAKKLLFTNLNQNSYAIINNDDRHANQLKEATNAKILTYGINNAADIKIINMNFSLSGTTITINDCKDERTFTIPLIGKFNVYNTLAAYALGRAFQLPYQIIIDGINKIKNVRGRFERIVSPKGWTAIVDYAHTPDALENCLKTISDILPKKNRGRIITVFGAGGDRDKTKRPIMGRIAGEYSDIVIVTSDNPRTEKPETIIDEIISGITNHASVLKEVNRKIAIERAVSCANSGDVVLVAGKGHEDYQIIGKEKFHFSDKEILEKLIL